MGTVLLLALLPSGCKTVPVSIKTLPEGNVRRLVESYPEEAEAARKVAPRFTRDALKTISRLEEELATRASPIILNNEPRFNTPGLFCARL